jgi:hypothetical protein
MGDRTKLRIHFNDGSTLAMSMPVQADNRYARELLVEEVLKRRLLVVEASGELHYIPFENVKYFSVSPVPQELPKDVLRGASVED